MPRVFLIATFALFAIVASQVKGQATSNDKPAVVAVASTGQIQGKIVAGNKPIGALTVSAYRMRPSPVVTAKATSAADGTFTIPGLGTGTYNICVTDKSGTYVDPCEWAALRTSVDVTDGKIATGANVSLNAASVLIVYVNDLATALVPKATEAFPPQVLVGVRDGASAGHLAFEAKRSPAGIEYHVVIPFDVPLFLNVQSKAVSLETTDHKPIAAQGLVQPIQHNSSKSSQPTVTFNAIGRNP